MGRHHAWVKLASVTLAMVVVLGLAACADSGKPVSASTSPLATYRNADYRFAITYDPRVFNAAAEMNRDEVLVGTPPQLDWSAWPVGMGSDKSDPAGLPYTVRVSAVDFVAQGLTSVDFRHERAMLRRDARRHGGSFDATNLGGAKGYRVEWADEASGNLYLAFRLMNGDMSYTVAVVCRLSDWMKMQGPLLAAVESFRTL